MTQARRQAVTQWLLAVLWVAAISWFSKAYTRDATRLATFWFANGLMVGLLLTAPADRWGRLLLAGFIGNVLGGIAAGDTSRTIFAIASIQTFEVLVAAWPLRNVRPGEKLAGLADLTRPGFFIRFALVALLLAPAVSGLTLVAYGYIVNGAASVQALGNWFVAHSLGMGIMASVTLAFQREELRNFFDRSRATERALSLLLLIATVCFAFWQKSYPLLFLVTPPLLFVAMRGGFAATSASLLLVAVIAVGFTTNGHGPLTLIDGSTRDRFIVLQLFMAVQMLTLFPVVLMRAERRRARLAADAAELRYRMLADHSNDVIILADTSGRRVYVSPAVQAVFGWSPEEFMQMSYRDTVHPEDLVNWAAPSVMSDATRTEFTRLFRAYRRDGTLIWIESHVVQFRDKDFARALGMEPDAPSGRDVAQEGKGVEGRVVTMRDVTRRRVVEQQLEAANRELASLVWKDGLTGLANRRRLDEFLQQEWQRALSTREPLAVILIDVDHFKNFNDCFGHQRGDRCLIAVANAITHGLDPATHLAARYGGEEFAVVLPNTSVANAHAIAERIRVKLLDEHIEHTASPFGVVSVSLGVAGCEAGAGLSKDELVGAADKALYRSKESGRNRSIAVELESTASMRKIVQR